ncbi:antitoxin [Streptomyces sp. NPDC089919]|uniref:antitoxin n=1 Tax=Streptomyces sp. NPDC089919 TaxID=3155188 RepID=UPI003436E586
MGIFDKAREMLGGKGKQMSDAVEQEVNERTGNKYADQVDKAQQEAERRLGIDDDPNK